MADLEEDKSSKKYSEAELTEQAYKLAQIEEIFQNISTSIKFDEGQDIIAFVGPTKAGKSTLINCLMGNCLICKKMPDTEETFIVRADGNSDDGPVIGTSGESETFVPKGYSNLSGTDCPMWDFPGFGDNKGTEQEIANAAAYTAVLKPQKSIRFVLVVPVEQIKSDNPMQFFKLLNDVVLICPNYCGSVCIVATKSEKGTVTAWLKKALDAVFANANKVNSKIIKNAKNVIRHVLDKGHCIDFKAPVLDDDELEKKFSPVNLQKIIDLIQKLKGTAVGDMPLVISHQAKHEIETMYRTMYDELSNEINLTCTFMNKYFETNIEEAMEATNKPETRVQLLKHGKTKLVQILKKTSNLAEFYDEANKNGFRADALVSNARKFAFIEKIQNLYKGSKIEEARGEKEFFFRIKEILNSGVMRYSELISSSEATSAEEKRLEEEHKKLLEKEKEMLKQQLETMNSQNQRILEKLAMRPYPSRPPSSDCVIL